MKKLPLLLILLILAGCGQPKQESATDDSTKVVSKPVKSIDTLQTLIDANINKQPAIDTIFLGFSFSMTTKQAITHYNQLVKEKKLVFNEHDGRKEYPMAFELLKANASIAPEFNNDKLYKISLVIAPADDIATPEAVYLQAAVTYMKKYKDFTLYQEPSAIDPKEKSFHWIKNNLHIYLHKTLEGTVVSYINMPVQQTIDKNKTVSADSSKTQTKKDI